jgi:hypothetical protein
MNDPRCDSEGQGGMEPVMPIRSRRALLGRLGGPTVAVAVRTGAVSPDERFRPPAHDLRRPRR